MADIIGSQPINALTPTAAERTKIENMKLARFIDRKNVFVVRDEDTGERVFVVQQELPDYLLRNNVKRYTVHSADRKVGRREMREAKRRSKALTYRTRVEEGETIDLPGAQGERIFFRVIRRGWFHARYFDMILRDPTTGERHERRRLIIDSGEGAAQIEPDLELYEGFREV